MKFPYGLSDFGTLILEHYFYQDRTAFIPTLEDAGRQLLFLRPRRFGKSLLLSMLEHYYDLNRANQFTDLFGHLAIGQQPTPLHNQFFVMKWDFSLVKAQGDLKDIEAALHQHINDCIETFSCYYQTKLTRPITVHADNALSSWRSALMAVQQTPHKLYLLIDEYDNFANEVMMAHQENYASLLYGEGLLKTVFKAVKAAAGGMGLDRVFITGVSPVVLSDMTSGYNVAKNIYLNKEFNALCGFTETEIAEVLVMVHQEQAEWPVTGALDTMRTFYNGYRFSSRATESVYNPTLSLYFLESVYRYGQYPEQLLDENLAMDRNKLAYIASLDHGQELLIQALAPAQLTIAHLAQRFGVEDMLTIAKDQTVMASLLYYFGILTLAGVDDRLGRLQLQIPNLVARSLYVEKLQELWLTGYEDRENITSVAEACYLKGDLQPLCGFIEQRYFKILSSRDYQCANELMIKIMFMTLLNNDSLYMMVSELELKPGYLDLAMILRPDVRQYQALDLLIEFKYLNLQELKQTGAQLAALSTEALARLPLVISKLEDATQQAQRYGKSLQQRYPQAKLHRFAVVALGLERLVWREVSEE